MISQPPSINQIFVENKDGSYTGFIQELPSVISEGSDINEAEKNLKIALAETLEVLREENEDNLQDEEGIIVKPLTIG